MQAATERRSHDDDRVPLDALIELTHADGGEVLEADAVDVSTGGLSLRASFMPPVGARMQCRFSCPPVGDRVVADCEVVWSAWEGPQAGAFGVRFLALDTRSATLIRRLLEPENEHVERALHEVAPEPTAAAPTPPPKPVASLHIDGLGAPIEADVQLDEADHVLLKQELSFLRLGRGVRVDIEGGDHRRGRIASVKLEHDSSDVPALSLGVLIDSAGEQASVPSSSLSQEISEARQEPASGQQALGDVRPESDEQDGLDAMAPMALGAGDTWPESPPFALEAAMPAQDRSEPEQVQGRSELQQEADDVGCDAAQTVASRRLEVVHPPDEMDPPLDLASETRHSEEPVVSQRAGAKRPGRRAQRETAVAVVQQHEAADEAAQAPVGDAARERSKAAVEAAVGVWDKLRPQLVQALARLRAEYARHAPGLQKHLLRLWSGMVAWLKSQLGQLRRMRQSQQKKRRTTAPPPRASNVEPRRAGRGQARPQPAAPGRGRLVLVGVLAFAGVAGAIYALAPRSRSSELQLHRPVTATPRVTAPAAAAAAAPAPAADDTSAQAASDQTAQPEVVAEPEAQEPSADAAQTDPRAFGDEEVPNGRTYTLRMSGPIESIEGEQRRNGFMVRIPGRLSLDRASPIATSHPALSRSLILNQGDRAELTIEFVKGKQPKYRVEAKGSSLEVTVERL